MQRNTYSPREEPRPLSLEGLFSESRPSQSHRAGNNMPVPSFMQPQARVHNDVPLPPFMRPKNTTDPTQFGGEKPTNLGTALGGQLNGIQTIQPQLATRRGQFGQQPAFTQQPQFTQQDMGGMMRLMMQMFQQMMQGGMGQQPYNSGAFNNAPSNFYPQYSSAPPQAYAPPPQAYAPPPQAYAPPPQAYAPPPQSFAPQRYPAPRPQPYRIRQFSGSPFGR